MPVRTHWLMSLSWLAFTAAHADTILTYETANPQSPSTVYVANTKVRLEMAGPQGPQVTIYDSVTDTLTSLNPQNKTYARMDEGTLRVQLRQVKELQQQVTAQVQEQLKNMPPEQRQKIEQRMAELGMGSTANKPPEIRVEKTDKEYTISGINCTEFAAYQGNEQKGAICVASESALNIHKNDYDTLTDLVSFMGKISEMAAGLAQPQGTFISQSLFKNTERVPVKLESTTGEKLVLTNINREARIPTAKLEIPSDYREVDLLEIMHQEQPKP